MRPGKILLASAALLVGACAAVPPEAGFEPVAGAVDERTGHRLSLREPGDPDPWVKQRLAEPLDLPAVVQLALLNNPQLQADYAQLRLAAAEVRSAVVPGNPHFSLSVLDPDESGASSIEAELLVPLLDLVLRAPRRRIAEGELLQGQAVVVEAVLQLASEAEEAWYEFLAASHRLDLARLQHEAATVGSLLGQRFEEAGNFTPLARALQADAAGEAQAALAEAEGQLALARVRLSGIMGLSPTQDWISEGNLSLPPDRPPEAEEIEVRAMQEHPALAVADAEMDKFSYALSLEQRFRGIGDLDVGASYERETDRSKLFGPVLELSLPLFDQGQSEIAMAQARLRQAGWSREAARNRVRLDLAASLASLRAASGRVDAYRQEVIPARIRAVDFVMRQYNYMLAGVFEVLEARRREFEAHQALVDALADYWIAAASLRRAAGGRLDLAAGPPLDLPRPPGKPGDAHENPRQQHQHGEHHEHTP